MWKIIVGFIAFAVLALFVIMKGGDNLDMSGEKHDFIRLAGTLDLADDGMGFAPFDLSIDGDVDALWMHLGQAGSILVADVHRRRGELLQRPLEVEVDGGDAASMRRGIEDHARDPARHEFVR